jgi:CheY-like chemotaxis protein
MRILVLDDDPARLARFKEKLGPGNFLLCVETAAEAILELRFQSKFDVVCLDHDLGEFGHAGGYGGDSAGNGAQVVSYMVKELEEEKRPEEVLVHSWNDVAATKMVLSLREASFNVVRRPFDPEMFK